MPADEAGKLTRVRIAVIDVGSNTARLLVADVDGSEVDEVRRERHYLRLGDDVHETGRIGPSKLDEAAKTAARMARLAWKAGAEHLQTVVTAPGRQAANGDELRRLLGFVTSAPVVQLDGDDEGRLAWEGAVARMEEPPDAVAVVDLGGGSCEVAVGSLDRGPEWVRSLDAGALRVTRIHLGSRPSSKVIARARLAIRELLAPFDPPRPDATLVVGGTARAIGRIVGPSFDHGELDDLVETLGRTKPAKIAERHGVSMERAETLLGGGLVFSALAGRLDSRLEVGHGGLREGAALALAAAARAAA